MDPRNNAVRSKLHQNADGTDLVFHPNNEHYLYSADREGYLYEWDLRAGGGNGNGCCVNRWRDESALQVTTLAAASAGRNPRKNGKSSSSSGSPSAAPIYLACGTSSGTVDLFSRRFDEDPAADKRSTVGPPTPDKTFDQLTTSISSVAFHESGEIMAFASKFERDALRLAHVGTKTVFSNWPGAKTPLRYVHSLAFSKNLLAVGNDKGKVLLYNLEHFG